MDKKMYDVIVVGAGIAGMTAAIYVARAGKSVLVLEPGVYGGQIVNALKVANWPGEVVVSGMELMKKIYHQMNNLGVEVAEERVIKIVPSTGPAACFSPVAPLCEDSTGTLSQASPVGAHDSFIVKTDDNEYSCGAIIIATGTEPRKLSEKQAKDAGERAISYCATCDGALYKDKPVVVVGSGNTAKHEIQYLENIASKVYQIHHDDPIPEEAVAVFVAIGRVPATEFLDGVVSLDDEGYVMAGEDCRTSASGIFVAGDCRTKSVRQLVTAAGDGAIAATEAVRYLNED